MSNVIYVKPSAGNQEDRIALWSRILGIVDVDAWPDYWTLGEKEVEQVSEARVIEQDVVRTRANEAFFRSSKIRGLMKQTLLRYCGYYHLQYMQGLNEILAPLLMISFEGTGGINMPKNFSREFKSIQANRIACDMMELDQDGGSSDHDLSDRSWDSHELHSSSDDYNPDDIIKANSYDSNTNSNQSSINSLNLTNHQLFNKFKACLLIFEKFVDRLAPVIFSTEGVQALQTQLASYHSLLYYFDAELSAYLSRQGMTADIYAPSWFITLFARRLPVHIALYLWDLLLQTNKSHLIILIGVAFILKHRDLLMNKSAESLPETLVCLRFRSTAEVNEVFTKALELEFSTPPSAVRDIHRLGFDSSLPENEREPGLYDLMYRPCLAITADDVASVVMQKQSIPHYEVNMRPNSPILRSSDMLHSPNANKEIHDSSSSNIPLSISPQLSRRYLIIDCREDGNQTNCIEGSLPIHPEIVEEICKAAQSQQASPDNEPDLGILTPTAAATLALLWSCRGDDIHFAVVGSDTRATPSPAPDTVPSSVSSLASTKSSKNNQPGSSSSSSSSTTTTEIPSSPPTLTRQSSTASTSSSSTTKNASSSVVAEASSSTSTSSPSLSKRDKGQSPEKNAKDEKAKSDAKRKRLLHRTIMMLPCNQLATALLILGFSRVSIVKGIGLPLDQMPEPCLPEQFNDLIPALRSKTDGYAALVYHLCKLGAEVTGGVVHISQDALIAQKVHQFSLSSSREREFRDIGGTGKGILGLEGMLRKLGGLQEGFVETVLLPQMHHAIGRLSIFHNHDNDDTDSHPELPNDSEAFELIAKMKIHSNAQSVSTGKTILREVKKATYALPPIADDLVALNRKFASFKKNMDSVMVNSGTSIVAMKKGIKTLPLPTASASASSSLSSSRIPTPVPTVFQSISRSRSLSSNDQDKSITPPVTATANNNMSASAGNTSTNNNNSNAWTWVDGIQKLIPTFGSMSLNQNKH